MAETKTVKVTLIKGLGAQKRTTSRRCAASACKGRTRPVEVIDTPETRGMINKISYMPVKVS